MVEVLEEHDGSHVDQDVPINQQQQEELPVPKPDAIIDPRAVVVHIQHAPVASRAVMAPVRLKNIANEAIPSPLSLIIIQVKAPKSGH